MKWNVKNLSEVANFTLGKMLDKAKNQGELKPYLANVNVRWGEFDLTDLREMKFEEHEINRYSLKYGDILMCEGGEAGRCAFWRAKNSHIMFQKALHRIRTHDCLDSAFLYYYFLNLGTRNGFEPYLTGATIKHLPREQLAKIEIHFPDLETQKKIASTLSHYDDLIQTNQQRIALLEEAAQRLYDEWFVKLRFPNYQQVPVVDGVPEGWEKVTFADVCESVGGGTPSTKVNEYWENGDVSWVTPTDITRLSSLILLDTEKKITQKGLKESSTKMLPPDTILMTSRASIGYFGLIDRPVCTNQGFISIIPNNNADRMFILFNLKNRLEEIDGLATGSTFKELSRRVFRAMNITLPPEELRQSFSSFVQPLFEQMRTIAQQNQKLTQARDELLPRLMSGQLNVTKLTLTEIN